MSMDLYLRLLSRTTTAGAEGTYRWIRDNDHEATVCFYLSAPGSLVEHHGRLLDSTHIPAPVFEVTPAQIDTEEAEIWWAVTLRYALALFPSTLSTEKVAETLKNAGARDDAPAEMLKETARALSTWLSSVKSRGQAVTQAARSIEASERVKRVFLPLFRHKYLDWIENDRKPANAEFAEIEGCLDAKWKYTLVLGHLAREVDVANSETFDDADEDTRHDISFS